MTLTKARMHLSLLNGKRTTIRHHPGTALALVMAALSAACGSSPTNVVAVQARATASAPAAEAPALPSAPVYPHEISDLASALPKDSALAIGLPSISGGAGLGLLQSIAAGAEVAKLTGLPEKELQTALGAFDGADLFVIAAPSPADKALAGCVVRFRDKAPVEALFAAAKLRQIDAIHWILEREAHPLQVAWLADARVAVVAFDLKSVDRALETIAGRAPSFAASPIYRAPAAGAGWLIADLARLAPDADDLMGPGSRVSVEAGTASAVVEYAEYGSRVPRLGSVLDPTPHDLLAKLPTGALFAADLSVRRPNGKTVRDVLAELGRPSGSDLAGPADSLLKMRAHVGLDEIDRALGDEIAVGVYMDKKGKSDPEKRFQESGVVLGAISTRDDKTARDLVDAFGRVLKSQKGVTTSSGKLTEDLGDSFVRVETEKGAVVIAFGAKKATADAIAAMASGKSPLGASAPFIEYQKSASKQSHVSLYADLTGLATTLGPDVIPTDGSFKDILGNGVPISSDITFAPSEKGIELTVRGNGTLGVAGAISAIGVYGVRRYLQESKAAEAKNTLGAIARGAVASYERELPTGGLNGKAVHALCGSAAAVPSEVQRGTKYAPSRDKGKDFDSGDDHAGWRCLRFEMDSPFYYRYDYHQGSGYKGPARGGPNPGPRGFEASAEGDLDGDGKTSLFTLTGKIRSDGTIEVAPDIFISDELE